jgi:hypothetical protein
VNAKTHDRVRIALLLVILALPYPCFLLGKAAGGNEAVNARLLIAGEHADALELVFRDRARTDPAYAHIRLSPQSSTPGAIIVSGHTASSEDKHRIFSEINKEYWFGKVIDQIEVRPGGPEEMMPHTPEGQRSTHP